MENVWEWLKGKKSYLVAAVAIVTAIYQLTTGAIDANTAWEMILAALGLAALRSGVTAENKK